MKKFYPLILLIISFCTNCQKGTELYDSYQDYLQGINTVICSETKTTSTLDEPVLYLAEKDFDSWINIISLEDRLNACNIAKSLCDSLSTDALIKSIIHYPLNYIVTAYNDPNDAIDIFFEYSNLHKELLTRKDAITKLVEYYCASLPSMDLERNVFDDDYKSLPLVNELTLGYLLLSDKFDKDNKLKAITSFSNELTNKCRKIISAPNLYGKLAAEPINQICKYFPNNPLQTKAGGDFVSYTTIYTPMGQSLQGIIREELDSSEIISLNNTWSSNYPNAIIRGSSSAIYNCHGFAWHLGPTENTVWLNSSNSLSIFQLNKYWTYDKYRSTSSTYAEKVHYSDDDHSALVLPNGNYISKWGMAPLMEHAPNYCPYLFTNIHYYCQKEIPLIDDPTVSIDGPYLISPNVSYNYYVQYPVNWLSYTITAESWLSDNTITMTRIGNYNATLQIYVSGYGPYDIIVKGYAGSTLYSTDTYTFACVGEMTARHIQEHQITDIRSYLEEHMDTISQ